MKYTPPSKKTPKKLGTLLHAFQINLSALCSIPMCLICFDTRIILITFNQTLLRLGLTSARLSYAIYCRAGGRLTCFSPASLYVDLLGPDGSWENSAGHCSSIRVQEGVAPPGGGTIVPEISLGRGVGEVDP